MQLNRVTRRHDLNSQKKKKETCVDIQRTHSKKSFKILITFEPFDQRIWIHDIKKTTRKTITQRQKQRHFETTLQLVSHVIIISHLWILSSLPIFLVFHTVQRVHVLLDSFLGVAPDLADEDCDEEEDEEEKTSWDGKADHCIEQGFVYLTWERFCGKTLWNCASHLCLRCWTP